MWEDGTSLTEAVVARMEGAGDPRFRHVMTSLIRHLHDFVREVELAEDEWLAAVRFLSATGRICEDVVHGRVLALDGAPLAGARLDVWQANGEGFYDVQLPAANDMQLRGVLETDADGRFLFRTVKPVSYAIPADGPVGKLLARMGRHPYRPAHIHFRVTARGFEPITTHLFVAGDPYLDSDAVFGVKRSLVVPFVLHPPGEAPGGTRMSSPFYTCEHPFRLVPEAQAAKRR